MFRFQIGIVNIVNEERGDTAPQDHYNQSRSSSTKGFLSVLMMFLAGLKIVEFLQSLF